MTGVATAGVVTRVTGIGDGYHSGSVPIATRGEPRTGYTLVDPSRGNIEVRDLNGGLFSGPYDGVQPTDADNRWGTGVADDPATANIDAYYAAEMTWDYLLRTHARAGLAGDGTGFLLMTNIGEASDRTASYQADCRCVMLSPPPAGDRSMNTIDIVAHELGHGLSGLTAGFDNWGESGGLNEASSDIIGTLVEFAAANPKDTPDYTIGEGTTGGPLRRMNAPETGCWDPTLADHDDTHVIGGPAIKFFYQLAVGSVSARWGDSPTCDGGPAVTGIGNDKAGRIWYRALTVHMVPNTDYAGARDATLRAAADLYGAGGVESRTVAAAWDAVGVDGSRPVPAAPTGPRMKVSFSWWDSVGTPTYHYVQVTHPQRQKVQIGATGLPPGLRLDPGTGRLHGTPTTAGEYLVTLTATDAAGNTVTREVTWDITTG
ncbi:M4 family metallopeptidase [Catenuloplanes japonicus]|uniref:M4 family metallopeptidase n=1 Tax=Catenuloplanes japonicus TaxID=33876 RepID=UPI0018DE107A|nr:M4 family metallopeptidase [Catenuloplanes japonicus]